MKKKPGALKTKWLRNLGIMVLAAIIAYASMGCVATAKADNDQHLEKAAQARGTLDLETIGAQRMSGDEFESEILREFPETEPIRTYHSLWTLKDINTELKAYGSFLVGGISEIDYSTAMEQDWIEVRPTGATQDLSIDLTKKYSFEDSELFMVNLAKYEGVSLHIIGRSVNGRNIYSLSLDFQPSSLDSKPKPTLLFTGQIHANEFAGSVFIIKQFSELVREAQSNADTRLLLERVRFEAIPIVNPDNREKNIVDGNANRKSNSNGVDLNRNFPSVSASQLGRGVKRTPNYATSPGLRYYTGPSLGSEPETKAVMKWLEKFVPTASFFLDYHQQGRGLYCGKPWDTTLGEQDNIAFGRSVIKFLNTGVSAKQYFHILNDAGIGFNGTGGTITDYALSLARGLKFSPKYGVLTLDVNGVDTPLLKFKDLDNCLEYYKPQNAGFCTATVEITKNEAFASPLGYSAAARKVMHDEYYRHNFDKLLKFMAELSLGMR